GADPAAFVGGSSGKNGGENGGKDGGKDGGMAAVGALFVAGATDPIIGRGMARFFNMLATPAEMMGDPELMARMAEVMAEPERYPLPPREGPSRAELLRALIDTPEGTTEDAVHV
ncbi:MAG TPA: hypothetical protein VFK43_21460, partial [Acidimicrobiales bacterium]|nr:hypothetical protein [Acidimicrobiales bacterium]